MPNADVVVNKFCYIDGGADPDEYLNSMAKLEVDHPDTAIVYTTMPLMTRDNSPREAFNNRVRDWCRGTRRILFDIADIESRPLTGRTESPKERVLCAEYSTDGGHLNALGSSLVAKGFYSLLEAIAERN